MLTVRWPDGLNFHLKRLFSAFCVNVLKKRYRPGGSHPVIFKVMFQHSPKISEENCKHLSRQSQFWTGQRKSQNEKQKHFRLAELPGVTNFNDVTFCETSSVKI